MRNSFAKLAKHLKITLVWTLAVLLGFQPAVLAAAAKTSTMDDLKTFLEASQITQKSQNLKEFLKARESLLSPQVYSRLMEVATEYPDAMIPKIDVTKIKGPNGEEQLQFSAIQDGKSASAVVVANKKVFIKVNGKTLSPAEMQNTEIYFKKVGLSDDMVQKFFAKREIASSATGILSAEQINKLPIKEKRLYFKQFRQLIESIEAVQQMKNSESTTSSHRTPLIDLFAQVVLGEEAFAAPGEDCVAAGYTTQTANNPNREVNGKKVGGETCGSNPDGSGVILESLNGDCAVRQFQCNPLVYGSHRRICISAGRDTTKLCNDQAKDNDIPRHTDLNSKDAQQEFFKLKESAMNQARAAAAVCAGFQRHTFKGMQDDQKETCHNLTQRIATIESWSCTNTDFKAAYKKICPTTVDPSNPTIGGDVPATGDDQGQGQTPAVPASPLPDGKVYCTKLPANMVLTPASGCSESRGTTVQNDPKGCDDGKGNGQPVCIYTCDNRMQMVGKLICPEAGAVIGGADGSGKDKDKKKAKKDEGINWWLIGGLGVAGLLAFHWMAKSSNDAFYRKLQPVPPNPAVPAPVAPVPRLTQ